MGTPDFSVPVLGSLVQAGHQIACVYTQPPRPAGRGKALRPSPVHARAEAMGIEVYTPASFRDPEVIAGLEALGVDAAIVVAYGQILPQSALDAPRLGCLNLHASLLPRWRGAAPIQRAIMAGDAETGVGVMQMDAGLDTGPVWAEVRTAIAADETAGSLHDRLSQMAADLIVETLPLVAAGGGAPTPQPDDGTTYAAKIDKAEARVDWTRPAVEIDRQIRGLSPFPGAWCEINGARTKLLLSNVLDAHGAPGETLDDELVVGTGNGAVRLLRLQRPGKGPLTAREFLNGTSVPRGSLIG
ncbi:MAG: methionyl-tRNA formyltransferase [Pseudomonadota bacterium]